MSDRPTIAVFSGPTATIQNSPPLITSGAEHIIRAQRLAAPAVVYIEAFSAHPLEQDAAALYASPDGYLDDDNFVPISDGGIPPGRTGVYRVVLRPSDGFYGLPYVALTRSGEPWDGPGLSEFADFTESRQTFYPDASRLYEEIDRFGIDGSGRANLLSDHADFEFFRAAPSGGYTTAEAAKAAGLTAPEVHGSDFFNYYPRHLRAEPNTSALVRATNLVQETLGSDRFIGGQWLEGSPTTEETLYWMNLLVDTKVPLVGHAAQRPHGTLSADGDRNILDGVRYLTSRQWANEGIDRVGAVMIVDEVVYAAREVAKTDARPGNYVATGGHGGIVGSTGGASNKVTLTYLPVRRHTHCSDLRLTVLPRTVSGVARTESGQWVTRTLRVRADNGQLAPEAMPAVGIMKFARYTDPCCTDAEITAWVEHLASNHPLGGIVSEGTNPYGGMDPTFESIAKTTAFCGIPVVKCGRGNTQGFTPPMPPWFIGAGNLTATKARILLMACLLKFGALPPAADPQSPTEQEKSATFAAVARYQHIFDTH
jgi:hypothetical protein